MANIRLTEIEEAFKEIFDEEDGKVTSVETVYELSDDEKFYKMVVSIHGLSMGDTLIIHTKFIFKADLQKQHLTDNSFIYLYDINCVYHKEDFDSVIDMKKKIEDVIESNNFGQDLQILSDFIEAPAMFINYYLKRSKITDYSVFDVRYNPKFKTVPCSQLTFDFDININNNYDIKLSIQKIDRKDDDEYDTYKFYFSFLGESKTFESETLKNVHFFIGSSIAKILEDKLK
jgi:hypothetical protein